MSRFTPRFAAVLPRLDVRFAPGAVADIAEDVAAIGGTRALVVSTVGRRAEAERIAAALGPVAAGICDRAVRHTPVEVTTAAMDDLAASGADCLVAIGGGSAIGLAKALALRTGLKHIAIPTTYSGSEATAVVGQTENGVKNTVTDPRVAPTRVVYDAELTRALPRATTMVSALNALAHAAEALYCRRRNPVTTMMALEGAAALIAALPRLEADLADIDARGEALYGAWLCGVVLAQGDVALQHKLAHTVGGSFNTPHAETHAILLPHTLAFNEAAGDELRPLAELLGGGPVGGAMWDFSRRIGAPASLAELGLAEGDLDCAADIAMRNPYWNPRPLERGAIRGLLQRAWEGARPE